MVDGEVAEQVYGSTEYVEMQELFLRVYRWLLTALQHCLSRLSYMYLDAKRPNIAQCRVVWL